MNILNTPGLYFIMNKIVNFILCVFNPDFFSCSCLYVQNRQTNKAIKPTKIVILSSTKSSTSTKYIFSLLSFTIKDVSKLPEGFPGGAVVGSLPANAGDTGSSPGLGGSHMPRSN